MNDLISDLDLVLHNDKALDLARMDMRKYLETRDPALIVELPGRKARRFTLRALDVIEAAGVMDQQKLGTKVLLAVRHALIAVTPGLSGDEAWRPAKEVEDSFGKPRPMMSLDEIDALFGRHVGSLGSTSMVELGVAIIDRYEQGNGDGGGVRYTLPPQSALVLEQSARQHAELARKTSATTT